MRFYCRLNCIFCTVSALGIYFNTFRILIFSPVFLYLLQVPWRFAGSRILCHFSDSQYFSSFHLSPSSSLAFCWKFSSLSFLGFSFALMFFFMCFMFLGVFLEFAFFVLSRIPSRSPVFIYLPHVYWHSPGSWVLFFLILIFSPIFRCILSVLWVFSRS